jgi:PAS domain S-box-containing protein
VTSKSGRRRGELRGGSPEVIELASVLRDLADSHGRTVRSLEALMPYSRTTISARLNGESRPSWEFVRQLLEACADGDRHAAALLEGRVRPLWEAAAPARTGQRTPAVRGYPGPVPADVGTWITAMRETASAQRVVAELQLSAGKNMSIVQGLTDMVGKLTAAAQVLAGERDDLRRELLARSDSAAELLRTRALLEDTQRRLEAAEQFLAQTTRRLEEAHRQRAEAERLRGLAVQQAASARRRLAAIEQHAVAFAEQIRSAAEVSSGEAVLMGEIDQSAAAEILDRVDGALGVEASRLDQLQSELAASSDRVVPLSAGDADNAALAVRDGVADPAFERYRALVQGTAQMIWVAAPDGRMLEDSEEWRRVTGQTAEEFLSGGWLGLVHPEDLDRAEQDWQRSLRTGRIFDERFRILAAGGSYRHYDVRAVPVERNGTIAEWVGACTDMTSQGEAEALRGRLTDALSAAALRTARLQQATAMLAEALDVNQVAEVITEIGRTAVGALRSAVALLDDDRLSLRVVNPLGLPPVGLDAAAGRLTMDSPSVMTRAIVTRRPVLIADLGQLRDQLGAGLDDATLDRVMDTDDEQAWVGLPMLAAGIPLGALRFSFAKPRTIHEQERIFLEALAGQCALAVERAGIYEREHATALTLQRGLLPGELPQVPGLALDARYLPQSTEAAGDWYDVFRLPDRTVAVAVGDVMGKGLLAAADMGRVRNALRALAYADARPAAVLTGLDRLFAATEPDEQVTTVTYLLLDPETGEGEAASAGHPPWLLLAPGAVPALDDAEASTPLGWASTRREHYFRLPPGATLVLYSNGLVQDRARGLDAGLDELVRVAASAPQRLADTPGLLLQYLLDSMLTRREQDDDVIVLVMHVPDLQPEEEAPRITKPEPGSSR